MEFFFLSWSWRGDDIKREGLIEGRFFFLLPSQLGAPDGPSKIASKGAVEKNNARGREIRQKPCRALTRLANQTGGSFPAASPHGLGVRSAYQRLLGAPARFRCGHLWNSVEPHRNPPTDLYLDGLSAAERFFPFLSQNILSKTHHYSYIPFLLLLLFKLSYFPFL
jgi:hypothetical protein